MSGTQNYSLEAELPTHHYAITPSDTINLPTEMRVRAGASGTVVLVDKADVAISYSAAAGELLPIVVKRVNATGTTSTGLIGLYS